MRIGELARRLGVSTRALRHYEARGLLLPAAIDPHTGYRRYGADELVRAVQIEQLKAAGLRLAQIRDALDDDTSRVDALLERRHQLLTELVERRAQLELLDGLLAARTPLSTPSITELPPLPVVVSGQYATASTLTPCIRHGLQRLRRRVRADAPRAPWTFVARFPISLRGAIAVEVAATHPDLDRHTTTWPPAEAMTIEVIGPHVLLQAAHDAALEVAQELGRTVLGVVQETYHQLGPTPHTTVSIPLTPAGR